jgi:transcriptional regulator with XRE-family HTH domain
MQQGSGFNAALKTAIKDQGKVQGFLARQIGIDPTRLSKIINGHLEATPDEKKLLAKALKKSVDHLFPEVAA